MPHSSILSTVSKLAIAGAVAAWVAAVNAQQSPSVTAPGTLQIYFIDVEGGQSTLIVTPSGQSLLIDAGFPGHANRIVEAARDAGISRIDNVLITHFHADHIGGVPELTRLMPVGAFFDHDDLTPSGRTPGAAEPFAAYALARRSAKHVIAKVGDRLPLNGLNAVVVSSDAATIMKALPGAGQPNVACKAEHLPAQEQTENPRSTGLRLDFGRFRFVDLGDLSGQPLFALFCPADLLGPADVYLVPHHAGADAAHPATLGERTPRVFILNNGSTKGGHADTFAALHRISGSDTWQLHRSTNGGANNFADDRIANLDETTTFWIKISAKTDGSFVVTNPRTGSAKSYDSR